MEQTKIVNGIERYVSEGICQFCIGEYEGNEPNQTLFFVRGKWMCGMCCNELFGSEEEHERAYGND